MFKKRRRDAFSVLDALFVVSSAVTFFVDIGTDLIVTVKYFHLGHFAWATMTMSILFIPAPIVQFFSIRWYKADSKITIKLWIVHALGFGVLQRYVMLLKLGLHVRKTCDVHDKDKLLQQQSDVCMLRLFESFLESAPQLVLQLYIMVTTNHWTPWTGISALASLISLSWGIASYSKAMRNVRPDKAVISWTGLILQTIWRVGMVTSRVTSLVIFAVAFKIWLVAVMAFHVILAYIWVTLQKTDFCSTWVEERVYNFVVAVIYCFCFFNLKEGRSRVRMTTFYVIIFLENLLFLLAYYHYYVANKEAKSSHWLLESAAVIITVSFTIGLFTMLAYYRYFHPSGPISVDYASWFNKISTSKQLYENSAESRNHRPVDRFGSVAVRTLKSNQLYKKQSSGCSLLDVSTNFESQRHVSSQFIVRNENGKSKSCTFPQLITNQYFKNQFASLPNISICDKLDISKPRVNAEAAKDCKCSNKDESFGITIQDNMSEINSGVGYAKVTTDNLASLEGVESCVYNGHEHLSIHSPNVKKIKAQLGHSISFGDIPLFPSPRRKTEQK
ncbi:XKR6 (predicted) [Pycnogonum litorale]